MASMTCDHGFETVDCRICYNAPGECSYGGCLRRAVSAVDFGREVRPVCRKHATDPVYGWFRAGGSVVALK